MRVCVRCYDGQEINLDVQPTDTIVHIKKQIQTKKRTLLLRQRLTFREAELDNDRTLSSYGIVEDAKLQLILRPPQPNGTIAGGFGLGHRDDEFSYPYAVKIHDDQSMIIVDWGNHRILQWKQNEDHGRIIAGGNGQGSRLNQLSSPTDVVIDQEHHSLLICDRGNRRILRWSLEDGVTEGEEIIRNIACWGIALDDRQGLYVSDTDRHQVKRIQIGDKDGPVVAGMKGRGVGLDQLNFPTYLFLDHNQNLYVTDSWNYRVMKWEPNAAKGKLVARGFSRGLFVDEQENVYFADYGNHRLMCWPKDAKEGIVLLEYETTRDDTDRIYSPWGVFCDRNRHLYVTDHSTHRIHRFALPA